MNETWHGKLQPESEREVLARLQIRWPLQNLIMNPFLPCALVGFALILGGGPGIARMQSTGAQPKRGQQTGPEKERQKYQEALADATPVQLDVMSDRQRAHSKLYSRYRGRRTTISGLVALAKERNEWGIGTGDGIGLDELPAPDTPENYFGKVANESDAVIRCKVTRKVSQITEEDSFIFTDYDVKVAEVLKDDPGQPIKVGSTIIVTRAGGKVLLDGIIVTAFDEYYETFKLNNHDLILFLDSVTETGAYKATHSNGSFELDGLTVHPLTGQGFPPGVLPDKQSGDAFWGTLRTILRPSTVR